MSEGDYENACELCGKPMLRGGYCDPCRRTIDGVSVPIDAPYEPVDAVAGGVYASDHHHATAMSIAAGKWPADWLK